jgi:hypothetical protein
VFRRELGQLTGNWRLRMQAAAKTPAVFLLKQRANRIDFYEPPRKDHFSKVNGSA